jgi:two-component system chemotaxis sensor kinase CheA
MTVLLFATRDGGRMAMPLSFVDRLEEFPPSAVERVGPLDVVQYGKDILPLIHVSRLLRRRRRRVAQKSEAKDMKREASLAADLRPRTPATEPGAMIQVVVTADKGQRVGLVVARIVDIVEATITSRSPARRAAVLFSTVIQGRVTEFLDTAAIIRMADIDSFSDVKDQRSKGSEASPLVFADP